MGFWDFFRKSAAASGYAALAEGPGRAVWTPRRYDRLAQEGYQRNVIAFRAIDEIARNAASVPLALFRGTERVEGHGVLDLLRNPNPMQSASEFRRAWTGYLLIGGNAFVEGIAGEGAGPAELWLRRPDRVQVMAGKGAMPQGYKYTQDGEARLFAVDPVTGRAALLHSKSFHPLNDWYGMSPMEAAAQSVDQFNAALDWGTALLQNGAKPSGILASAEPLSDGQFERLKGQMEELYQGARNAGRPMLLEGGLSWQEMGYSPRDMDFIEAKHMAAREIAQAFGVPPQLLGIPGDSTFSNYQEARQHFWENTVVPLVSSQCDDLNQWLLPQFGEFGLELRPVLDDIPALAPRRAARWAAIAAADFLSDEEKRAMLGYGSGRDGGD
jgi:HK97 family phage portal protein